MLPKRTTFRPTLGTCFLSCHLNVELNQLPFSQYSGFELHQYSPPYTIIRQHGLLSIMLHIRRACEIVTTFVLPGSSPSLLSNR